MVTDSLHLPTLFEGDLFAQKRDKTHRKPKNDQLNIISIDTAIILLLWIPLAKIIMQLNLILWQPDQPVEGFWHQVTFMRMNGALMFTAPTNERADPSLRLDRAVDSGDSRLQQQRCTRAVHLVTQQTQRASLTSLVLLSFQTWISSKQTQTHRSSGDDSLIPVTLYNSQTAAQFSSLIWDQTHLCIFNVCCAS